MGVVAPTAPDQRAALVDLYIATNGSGWGDNYGWQDYASGSDPCENSWVAVTCSGSSGSPNRDVTYVVCAPLSTGWGSTMNVYNCASSLWVIIPAFETRIDLAGALMRRDWALVR